MGKSARHAIGQKDVARPPGGGRRRFLAGGLGRAGALVIGWGLMPPRQRLDADPPEDLAGRVPLNGWVLISRDNRITVMLAKSEMGQGVMTALPMLVAEELDVPLSMIDVRQAPMRKIYGDTTMASDGLPFHPEDNGWLKRSLQWMTAKAMREVGLIVTGGSSSVKDSWLPMREAGAAARARLVAAAAHDWKVPPSECETGGGRVTHPSGLMSSYGELAEAAARIGAVDFRLKDRKAFKLIGRPTPRIDADAKVNGSAVFGLDVKLPGMLYAGVAMCPVPGGALASVNADAIEAMKGVKKVISLKADRSGAPDAVAVVADSRWHAMQAVKKLELGWEPGPHAKFDSASMMHALAEALDGSEGFTYYRKGDVAALKGARTVNAEYHAPLLAHAAMEPVNCTAQFADGRVKLWVPTQVPSVAVSAAARIAGVPAEQVDLHVTLLGGGFGRRLDADMVVQAVTIARELDGAPVQLLWRREDDLQHDFYRPASVVRLQGQLDGQGRLAGWRSHSASGSAIQGLTHRAFGLPKAGPDKTTCEGLFDHPYEEPHQQVSHVIVDMPVPLGTWRSVGHSQNAFFKESFIDELAHAGGQEPAAFRLALLQKHPRQRAVLEAALRMAGEPEAGRAHGIALHQSFGTIVAQVAEVSVDGRRIQVHKVSCAIDCGLAVNPEGVRLQVESAIALGLSAALNDEITLRDGRVQQSNFHDYRTLRITEMPAIEVVIIQGGEHPEGAGEPGTPPIAPAVANAVFRLTGQRLRSLPLRLA